MPKQKTLLKREGRNCICCPRTLKHGEPGAITLFSQMYESKGTFGNLTLKSIVICKSCLTLALAGYQQPEGRKLHDAWFERLRTVFNHAIEVPTQQGQPENRVPEGQCELL